MTRIVTNVPETRRFGPVKYKLIDFRNSERAAENCADDLRDDDKDVRVEKIIIANRHAYGIYERI